MRDGSTEFRVQRLNHRRLRNLHAQLVNDNMCCQLSHWRITTPVQLLKNNRAISEP